MRVFRRLFLSYPIFALANQEPLAIHNKDPAILHVSPEDWRSLNGSVHGRLHAGSPFAKPCFARFEGGQQRVDQASCQLVRNEYLHEISRTSYPSAYINTQWETCQSQSRGCLLDHTNINSSLPTTSDRECYMGSIPSYYIDVNSPEDVRAALSFSQAKNVPLVIKNTGHDYKGRSSAPYSLALWLHNLKDMTYHADFVPSCSSSWSKPLAPVQAVTLGAGVQWVDVYNLADAYNITVVGGADRTVGTIGGWLQGGGHSALSNGLGLGVDRVLEFTVVTPDGVVRTANECQNEDLFYALRGGGGGTFGIVLSATILGTEEVNIQAILVQFPLGMATPEGFGTVSTEGTQTSTEDPLALTRSLFSLILHNSLGWAKEGWGGYITANSALYLTPMLGKQAAVESMQPLAEWAQRLKNAVSEDQKKDVMLVQGEFGSWMRFFKIFADGNAANLAEPISLSSRLIPSSALESSSSQAELLEALLTAQRISPGLRLIKTTPFNYRPDTSNLPSVHPAWRSSIFHVTNSAQWSWNTSIHEVEEKYKTVRRSMEEVRKIAGKAAYVNEADVYEDEWEETFYGPNYQRLLEIKNKYDPNHILDCWQCVGWNRNSPRYSCYPDLLKFVGAGKNGVKKRKSVDEL